jgi:hypothetical protein
MHSSGMGSWNGYILRRLPHDSNSVVAYDGHDRPASAANASDFVQIPLSQVPRRETLGSTRTLGAGALVDRALRFYVSYRAERCETRVVLSFRLATI